MQATDQVGPKILFDLSQVETGFPVRYLHYGLESKARVRHPGIHLPKSDSGKYTIQVRVGQANPTNLCCISTHKQQRRAKARRCFISVADSTHQNAAYSATRMPTTARLAILNEVVVL